MKSRMKNPVIIFPNAMKAMQDLHAAAADTGLPESTVGLVQLRVSQINGCSVCVDGHWRMLKKAGEADERVIAVAAWRDSPFFTDAERAAFALGEAATRISDRPEPVPDEIWEDAARHFDEKALAALIIQIAAINVWNRLNVITRQVAGEWRP